VTNASDSSFSIFTGVGYDNTVIMVIGTDIISIIGATVVAGSVLQVEVRIRYRTDIAADV